MKIINVIVVGLLFLSPVLFSQTGAGNGQEDKATGIMLEQIPDKEAFLAHIAQLAPDFPCIATTIKVGITVVTPVKQPYVHPKYNAYSTHFPSGNLFVIDFYENYYEQPLRDRLGTLTHEFLHYAFRHHPIATQEERELFDRRIEFMTSLIASIVEGDDEDHSLKFKLSKMLTGLVMTDGAYTWKKDARFFLLDLDKYMPTKSIMVGGMNNTVKDFETVSYRANFNPYYRNYFFRYRGRLFHDAFEVDWSNQQVRDVFEGLGFPVNILQEELDPQWHLILPDTTYSLTYEIKDRLALGDTAHSQAHIMMGRVEEPEVRGMFDDWERYNESFSYRRDSRGFVRFLVSVENLIPNRLARYYEELQFILNPSLETLPEQIKTLIQEACNGEIEIHPGIQHGWDSPVMVVHCTHTIYPSAWKVFSSPKEKPLEFQISSNFPFFEHDGSQALFKPKTPGIIFEIYIPEEESE